MTIDFTNIMRNKTDYLSMDEIDTMLQFCYQNKRLRDYMLLLTLARTGRRVSEIVGKKPYIYNVGLRPVDLHDGDLIEFDILKKEHIKTKDKRGKNVSETELTEKRLKKFPKRLLKPVDSEYYKILKLYIQQKDIQPYDRVFPISRQRVDLIVKDVAKQCKIARAKKKIHAHCFRHGIAINLLKDNPTNPYVLLQVKELLAHSSIQVTQHYAQFTPEDIKITLNKLYNKKEGEDEN